MEVACEGRFVLSIMRPANMRRIIGAIALLIVVPPSWADAPPYGCSQPGFTKGERAGFMKAARHAVAPRDIVEATFFECRSYDVRMRNTPVTRYARVESSRIDQADGTRTRIDVACALTSKRWRCSTRERRSLQATVHDRGVAREATADLPADFDVTLARRLLMQAFAVAQKSDAYEKQCGLTPDDMPLSADVLTRFATDEHPDIEILERARGYIVVGRPLRIEFSREVAADGMPRFSCWTFEPRLTP